MEKDLSIKLNLKIQKICALLGIDKFHIKFIFESTKINILLKFNIYLKVKKKKSVSLVLKV